MLWALVAVSGLFAMTAEAADVSFSGFGTLGYAQSNQPYNYERFINNKGTFARDSVAGVQADIKFTDQLGATIQGKIAPSLNNDSTWAGTLSWAFVSWRPSDDWLIRVGKQRDPFYLYSESLDVGETYDFARLPTEMYSLVPNSDYTGASISKTWNPDLGELTLDGYAGSSRSAWRFYIRDNTQIQGSTMQPGANFENFNMTDVGLALNLLRDEDRYRVSFHKIKATADPGQFFVAYDTLIQPSNIGLVNPQLAPLSFAFNGSTYTALSSANVNEADNILFTLGTEIKLPKDFRFIGEFGRRKVSNIVTGADTNAGYVSLLKDIDAWTPYFSYAAMKSRSDVISLYQSIGNSPGLSVSPAGALAGQTNTVNAVAGPLNASKRLLADGLVAYDQYTIALGTSYRLTPTQKIKFEWARTHVGVVSSFVDAPSGGSVSNQNIDVLSLSYNFAF